MTNFTFSGHGHPPAASSDVVVHEYDEETPPSIALVKVIAALENVDPTDVPIETSITLYDHIDPGGLDAMLGDGSGDGTVIVSFDISGPNPYRIEITDDGRIAVQHDRNEDA